MAEASVSVGRSNGVLIPRPHLCLPARLLYARGSLWTMQREARLGDHIRGLLPAQLVGGWEAILRDEQGEADAPATLDAACWVARHGRGNGFRPPQRVGFGARGGDGDVP